MGESLKSHPVPDGVHEAVTLPFGVYITMNALGRGTRCALGT